MQLNFIFQPLYKYKYEIVLLKYGSCLTASGVAHCPQICHIRNAFVTKNNVARMEDAMLLSFPVGLIKRLIKNMVLKKLQKTSYILFPRLKENNVISTTENSDFGP